tara:strand:+ start:327 stop:788 length:462 start_codon:yes stop_codon:yes gene_type:complete
MKWFVLYTKPHHEIKVARALEKIGIKSYCPVINKLKQFSDRKKKVTKPLLSSYVLVKIANNDRNKVFGVPGIIRYVYWLGKPAVVRDQEIELMQNNLSGIYNEISISKIKKGTNYKIPSGPFQGQEGKVVNLFKNKIKLELPSFGILLTLKTA